MARAAGLIIYRRFEHEMQYLLLQASDGIHHWTPPKGHVDPGEKDETTALRETEEECGLRESQLSIDWSYRRELKYTVSGPTQKTVVYWIAKLLNPSETTVTLSSEHQDFKWLALEAACEVSNHSDMNQLLRDVEAYLADNGEN